MLADETFRDNVASLATLEGSIAEKQSADTLNKMYEIMAGWTIQQQTLPLAEVHPTIGFIPPPKAGVYIDRGQIEDDLVSFFLSGSGAIVGVHAPGGLGKTELAKVIARKLKSEYEVLWIDVGKKETQQVMGEMLMKCGVQVQPGINYEQLKNELQSVYLTKRYLVIFDDVRKNALDKLGDLLPPKPSSALVTSRIQQIGGVQPFPLKEMTWGEASQLFRAVLKDEIYKPEEETLKQLAERCKFNPLAMEIAARNILQKQGFRKPVALYFEQALTKFSALKAEGDERWDMHAIFEISYEELSETDQEKFRWLSAFHPTGFSAPAVSYLWKMDEDTTRQILSRFINLSLVKPVPMEDERLERYRLHDLLDEYALEKLKLNKEEGNVKLVFAEWVINLFKENDIPSVENLPFLLPERDNLLHACEWARGEKQADILALLTTTARNWFYINFTDAWLYWFAWLEACLQLGVSDKRLEANVLQAIGDVQKFRDERDQALESYHEALQLFKAVGAKLGEANVYYSRGKMLVITGKTNEGLAELQSALDIYGEVGLISSQANIFFFLGQVFASNGQKDEAIKLIGQAVELGEKIDPNHPVTLYMKEFLQKVKDVPEENKE